MNKISESHPRIKKSEHDPHAERSTANYHGLPIEIKSNHPMTNSYNYSLAVDGKAELSEVKDPSPRGKGKDHTKHNDVY